MVAVPTRNATLRQPRAPWQLKYLALALIWGSSFMLMMVGLRVFDPIQIAAMRILLGLAALLVLLRVVGGRLPRGAATWGHISVSAVFLSTAPFTLFAASEERIPSALAGIANATTPLTAVLVGWLLLPADRLPPRRLAAVLAGFGGVVVIAQPWHLDAGPDLLGLAMAIGGAACYGIGWTYNRRFLAGVDIGGLSQPTATLLAGAVQVVIVITGWWLLTGERAAPWTPTLTAIGVGASPGMGDLWLPLTCVALLGLVGTGLAYMFQFDVVRAAGPNVGTTVTYLIPVVSVVLGVLLLAERLAWPQLLGAVVIVSSAVVLGSTRRGSAPPVETEPTRRRRNGAGASSVVSPERPGRP